jgi:hypothetical protein
MVRGGAGPLALAAMMTATTAVTMSRPLQAAPVTGDQVAVLPLAIEGRVPARPAALETAISKGLEVAVGAPRVQVGPPVAKKLSAASVRVSCGDPRCWVAVGQALGARHLVSGLVQRKGANFEVEFRLIDALDGHPVLSERNQCEAADCSVAELCRLTVLELGRKGLGKGGSAGGVAGAAAPLPAAPPALSPAAVRPTSPATSPTAASPAPPTTPSVTVAAATPPTTAAPAAPSSPVLLTDARPADAEPEAASSWRSWYPAVGIASGVAIGAVGGFLISKDGSGTCGRDHCHDNYTTMTGGIAAVTGGALLVTSGLVVWLIGDPQALQASRPSVSVGVGPRAVSLSGRF